MRLYRKVILKLFQDDYGNYGVTNPETIGNDISFQAFWNGIGIFHDVFEHWFENVHKYFRGEFGMNSGGEIAAQGASYYYYYTLGARQRKDDRFSLPYYEGIINSAISDIERSLSEGRCEYGQELMCNVPYQSPISNGGEFEGTIYNTFEKIKDIKTYHGIDPEDIPNSEGYRKSINLSKITRLYRYGYRMGQRYIPDNNENRHTTNDFIVFWENFCKMYKAQDLQNVYQHIEFRIYHHNGDISWRAYLVDIEGKRLDVKKYSY